MRKSSPLPPPSLQVRESRYCVLSTSTAQTQALRVLMAGREACSEDYLIRRSGYPSLALEIVAEGHGILKLRGKTIPLHAGMIFTYGPGITHVIQAAPGVRLVKYFVDFTGKEGARLLKSSGLSPGKTAMARDPASILRLIELILVRSGVATASSKSLCCDYLRAILKLCGETIPLNAQTRASSDCHNRAVALIESDYASIGSVTDLARRLDVTPEHLTRTFRSMGDDPPLKLLTIRKLKHAADLLLAGGCTVKGVASDLGFLNPFHFSAVFKRHFGYPPRTLQGRLRGSVLLGDTFKGSLGTKNPSLDKQLKKIKNR